MADVNTEPRLIGFWADHPCDRQGLPWPECDVWPMTLLKERFITALSKVEAKAKVSRYRGWSTCRICGAANGSQEYALGLFRWPEGYKHYLTEHGVDPPNEFKKWVWEMARDHTE